MKDAFLVHGLNGEKKLSGSVQISGAKNAVLKAMAASLLFEDELVIENAPAVADVKQMSELLAGVGVTVATTGTHTLCLASGDSVGGDLDHEIAKRMRASVVLTGPLLARFGKVSFPHPGGCVIGARPIDLFLHAFEKMGATVRVEGEQYHIEAKNGLSGARHFLSVASVGVTETVMLAAVLAKGKTIIENAALEPEIAHLAAFLVQCGALIKGAGTPTIEIEGGELLHADGAVYSTLPDRIEAGSFLILGALLGEKVEITHCVPDHFRSLISLLEQAGVEMTETTTSITVTKSEREYSAINVKTHEYPGFPTDLQAPLTVFLTQANGESLVFETMFEGRLHYTEDLVHMGADIRMFDPHRVLVKGKTPLKGKELVGPDLRAGLAFLIAALVAKGESKIDNVYYIDRGYAEIEKRLTDLGATIERITL